MCDPANGQKQGENIISLATEGNDIFIFFSYNLSGHVRYVTWPMSRARNNVYIYNDPHSDSPIHLKKICRPLLTLNGVQKRTFSALE